MDALMLALAFALTVSLSALVIGATAVLAGRSEPVPVRVRRATRPSTPVQRPVDGSPRDCG